MAGKELNEGGKACARHGDAGEKPRPHVIDRLLRQQLIERKGDGGDCHEPRADGDVLPFQREGLAEDQHQARIAYAKGDQCTGPHGLPVKNSAPKSTTNKG